LNTTRTHISRGPATAVAAVLIAGTAFAGGSLTAADAGAPKAITRAQVKKIAKKVADKEISKQAPNLSVGHAGSADFATSAGVAASAAKLGTSTVKTFSAQVLASGTPVVLMTVGPLTLTGSCTAGVPVLDAASSAGGQLRFSYIDSAGGVGHSGSNNLVTITVNATPSGTGSFDYTTGPGAGSATDASYSWRNDNGNCQFLGSYVTG
jgi:hypothetical protein